MHALRKYLREGMDAQGMKPADFARASGLSEQLVSQMLNDSREQIGTMPKASTIDGIARAFRVDRSTVALVALSAMGYTISEGRTVDLSTLPNDRLIDELRARLVGQEQGHEPPPMNVVQLPPTRDEIDRGDAAAAPEEDD